MSPTTQEQRAGRESDRIAQARPTTAHPGESWRQALRAMRALGPIASWIAALVCGWKAWQDADLLDAVLRGAGAWLGTMVVWLAGAALCDQLVGMAEPPQVGPERSSAAGSPEAGS